MNDNELRQAQKNLYDATRSLGGWRANGSQKQKYEGTKLDCIEMINSILAYAYLTDNAGKRRTGEEFLIREEKSRKNYLEDYVKILGRDVVVKLINEQLNDISHINYGVFTDSEGCTYNSIVWKDRQTNAQ